MPKKIKPKKSRQGEYRRTTFSSAQYWNLNYTERYGSGIEKDFKAIIYAKSYQVAIHILKARLYEDDPKTKVKAIQGFMFHKDYHSNSNGRLGVKEWEQIRKSSFPNENNFLFKLEIPRSPDKTNRFNRTDFVQLKSIGFAKGESNWSKRNRKGKVLPIEERAHKIWRGHWVDWDPSLRQAAKNKLIEVLVKSNNNRTHASELLGVSRNSLYKQFSKFPEVDWKKEYPPPSPPRPLKNPNRSLAMKASMARRLANGELPFGDYHSPSTAAKRIENMTKAKRVKRQAQIEEMLPKLDLALKETEGNRSKAAQLLELSPSVFGKLLRATKDRVNWSEKYPSKFANKRYDS
jgi:DNA-binding protein Fis